MVINQNAGWAGIRYWSYSRKGIRYWSFGVYLTYVTIHLFHIWTEHLTYHVSVYKISYRIFQPYDLMEIGRLLITWRPC